ncbi:LLM class flavin-dependent oxidoreductase [Nakamurella leprariae]|uniref:LLM class flavin-dependent oxidoreductase n=1 Tax=Nakamurella leprariae TaxID=2803911 RepID=A0A938YBU0_9ACTN|nr:LLM class flavin-dependent oxidoreductase [Nakamurella leprariae]MBM9466716.1 LLM class flavin-dependent oxidoreductase [Nakamurella leprariae]
MHINLFLRPFGNHQAAWRYPGASVAEQLDPATLIGQARTAERGLFDSVFLADAPGLGDNPWNYLLGPLEPLTLLGAIASRTERIGLIGTVSTTYSEPYNLARQMASLDHISRGRAGWNIVTTASSHPARNFGATDRLPHAQRYARAAEYVDVVLALWHSWQPDAIVGDKATGVLADPERVSPIDHRGEFFTVAGPLDIARPPQGHPVLVQAGSSTDGRSFAARYAEAIFTAQETIASGRQFATDVRAQARAAGRDGDAVRILPGLSPVLADTAAQALDIARDLRSLNIADNPLRVLSELVGFDLLDYAVNDPFPVERLVPVEEFQGHASRYGQIVELVRSGTITTVGDLVGWHEGGRGHRYFVGTAAQLADDLIAWVEAGAADGFNLMPALIPDSLDRFVDEVVPILQERGHFRTQYSATTLRGHFTEPVFRRSAARAAVPGLSAAVSGR